MRWFGRTGDGVRRRSFGIGLVAAGMAIGLLVGWSGPMIGRSVTGEHLEENTELVVLSGQDLSDARADRITAWNRAAREWNREHPDRRRPIVRVEWLPSSATEQLAEMLRRARSQQADVDVYVLDVPWTRQFVSARYVRELHTTVEEDDFLAGPLSTCKNGDALYALPLNTDTGLLFGQPGLPTVPDWPRLVAAGTAHAPPTRAAFGGQFGHGEAFVVNVLEGVMAHGGQILRQDRDADGSVTVSLQLRGPGVAEALRDLSKDLHDTTRIPAAADGYDEAATRRAFLAGQIAYMRNWPAFAPRDPQGTLLRGMRVSPLPWRSVLGGQNLAVATKSPHPEAATRFIEWLSGEASQVQLFGAAGFAPTRSALYHDPQIYAEDDEKYLQTILEGVQDAVRRPDVPDYLLFSEVFEEVMRRALTAGHLRDVDIAQIEAAAEGKYLPVPAASGS